MLLLFAAYPSTSAAKPELPPSNEAPTPAETDARKRLAGRFPGRIIFDSNRGKGFGIYVADAEGNVQTLLDRERHEMYPDVSPDGSLVVYSSEARRSAPQVWIVSIDGSQARMLSSNGEFPSFSADGKAVYFNRDRKFIISHDLATGAEKEIFPLGHELWSRNQIAVPRVSPDGSYVAFATQHPRRWSSWYVNVKTGESQYIGKGCEPTWFAEGEKLAWIGGATPPLERTQISAFDRKSGQVSKLQDADAPRGHEYFPSVTKDDRFLLFTAARPKEHAPESANYQLFVKEIETGEVTRITFDRYTNRWPKLLASNSAK